MKAVGFSLGKARSRSWIQGRRTSCGRCSRFPQRDHLLRKHTFMDDDVARQFVRNELVEKIQERGGDLQGTRTRTDFGPASDTLALTSFAWTEAAQLGC
jgi:hypothetical protein